MSKLFPIVGIVQGGGTSKPIKKETFSCGSSINNGQGQGQVDYSGNQEQMPSCWHSADVLLFLFHFLFLFLFILHFLCSTSTLSIDADLYCVLAQISTDMEPFRSRTKTNSNTFI